MKIDIERAYDSEPREGDYRVLVDRLWPRGLSRDKLALNEWLKEIAPSTELRKWFGHNPERWDAFRIKYMDELRERHAELERLRQIASKQPLLLLYGAHDTEHNQAVVLRAVLKNGFVL